MCKEYLTVVKFKHNSFPGKVLKVSDQLLFDTLL